MLIVSFVVVYFFRMISSDNHSTISQVPEAQRKFEECIAIIGSDFCCDGQARVGATKGFSSLYVRGINTNQYSVIVKYAVLLLNDWSDTYTEEGTLSNFRMSADRGLFGTNQIIADWTPSGSGSGLLYISIIKNNRNENAVYIGVQGKSGNFEYFDNISLDSTSLNSIITILGGTASPKEKNEPSHDENEVFSEKEIAPSTHNDNEGGGSDSIIVTVDYLRVRADSNSDSEVLAKVRRNEILFYLHNQSVNSEKVNVNGIENAAPWYHVKTNKGIIGWVHGSCIQKIQ